MTGQNNPQTLKGFRDFLGLAAKRRLWLSENIRCVFETYGFEPLETPALEYESLLLGKYGKEADKLIYGFEDRGGRRVALRYDQTVPTARIVSQYQNQMIMPYKRYQIQPVWRADKPQKGRFREFMQCDADIVGSSSLNADAEILAVYAGIYKKIGLNSLKIKINDRQDLIKRVENSGIDKSMIYSVIQTIDKLDKKPANEVIAELVAKGITNDKAVNLITDIKSGEIPTNLSKIVDAAVKLGVNRNVFIYEPTLARGLDYYTGMIFEGIIPEYPVGSVGGGGRYDNLLQDLVGVRLPAVGFGLGFDRTLEAAEILGKIPDLNPGAEVLVTVFSQELAEKSREVTLTLRNAGISAEYFLEPDKSLDKQLRYANKKGVPYVIIIGPEEAKKGNLIIKNMKMGEQKEVPKNELLIYFQA